MTVRLAGMQDVPRIDRFVRGSDSSNFYHDYRWGKVAENCFGHRYYVLVSEDPGGEIDGLFPFVHFRSMAFGNFMVSMPYYNYGGVCANDDDATRRLIGEAVRMAKELKARHIEFRQERSLNNGFIEKTHKVSMRLKLPVLADDLWKSFPSKLRSQVKVPQKAGLTCRFGRVEELDAFYEVFSRNMRDLGTPVYPKRFFRTILGEFPENTWIGSVYKEDVPVASGFLAGFKTRLEIPWASSLRGYNRFSPNMLLYWSCLKFGCENGYATFDFGRSTEGESTYRFKEQWGAVPSPMIWSYWVREGCEVPELTPRNPKFQLAIEIWKRLPLPVTNALGPRIIGNIP
ncbi:MAG: FemAB family PEP-CTERM system-associated protein [Deltaproteobacteria bacterium]|nr:FemAB family PEP-CTERM system-associated protein [Deltaproteobacteria bacterium]